MLAKGQLALERNPNWKGGRSITGYGYVEVKAPGHPNANRRGYVFEHRLVMERALGRYLRRDEIVHHKNGVKTDNRPENLELTTPRDHMRHHRTAAYRYTCSRCGDSVELRKRKRPSARTFCGRRCACLFLHENNETRWR